MAVKEIALIYRSGHALLGAKMGSRRTHWNAWLAVSPFQHKRVKHVISHSQQGEMVEWLVQGYVYSVATSIPAHVV